MAYCFDEFRCEPLVHPMLLQLTNSLEEIIVKELAAKPWVSAAKLHGEISAKHGAYTLRGIYKELAKLEREGIVVKVREDYSLRLAWVIHLLSFVDLLYDVYLDPKLVASLLHQGQDKVTWHFNNLTKMDMVWTQLMLGMHCACPGKVMCIWCPHQWFDLAHGEKQRQFMRANELAENKRLHIIGGRTYLDEVCIPHLPKSSRYSFAKSPFEELRSVYYTLIGEYLITVKLDRRTTERIEQLFDSVGSERDKNAANLVNFFSEPVKASLTLEKNAKKAQQIKKKFALFFGVSLASIG